MQLFHKKLKRFLVNKLPINIPADDEILVPFFIIGSGRNGSTLLATILNNHPNVFIPPEQYALPHLIINWHYKYYRNWENKLKSNIDFFLNRSYHWKIDKESTFLKFNKTLRKEATLLEFVQQLYFCESLENNKSYLLYADKTPYNTFYIPLLLKVFPTAKFIFLNRDPRDVSASMKRMFPLMSIDEIIYRWEYSFKSLVYLQNENKSVYICQYENFVQNPELYIREIQDFIGIKKEKNILVDYDKKLTTLGVSKDVQHSNIYQSINTKSIGTYQNFLQVEEIKLIETKLEKYLSRVVSK